MSTPVSLIAGAACGLLWWYVSLVLGARDYGVLGTNPWTGPVSGACSGAVVAGISVPFYRRSSVRALWWYSPLSVYLSIGVYGLAAFVIRLLLNDFHPNQIRWAVGVQGVVGMWWGVTFLLPVAIIVHLLAYANHRVLRRAVVPS